MKWLRANWTLPFRWMRDSDGFWTFIAVLFCIAVVAVLCVAAAYFVIFIDGRKCATVAEEMKVRHRYGLIAGCRVEWEGRFVPLDILREQDL